MTNFTITVDEQTLKRARRRALEEGMSANAVLRDYLESYGGVSSEQRETPPEDTRRRAEGWHRLRSGRKWMREELYDREGLRE
jgi:hypothetical protein